MCRSLNYSCSLLLCLFTFACSPVQQVGKYKLPSEDEINEVIHAVIVQDSLFQGEYNDIPLSIDLYKLEIYFPDTSAHGEDLPPPPPPWINNFYELVGIHGKNAPFVSQDSSYILYQRKKLVEFMLDTTKFNNLNFTTRLEQEQKISARDKTAFYYFSIPLFNNDQSKAYIELMFICKRLYGYGNGYVLEKINGNWAIARKDAKWYE